MLLPFILASMALLCLGKRELGDFIKTWYFQLHQTYFQREKSKKEITKLRHKEKKEQR